MPSWNDLISKLESQPNDQAKSKWLNSSFNKELQKIGTLRKGRNVIFYASAFLQKPQAPAILLQITHEEINGFMSVMNGMDWDKDLTLILHTPGGATNATETIVAYLRSKFNDIEVVIPTYAMSAGTMISLASDRVIMGRQSQMGPIDPQMLISGRIVSATAIIDQFERAKKEILEELENDQDLQEAVLTAYHLMTITFEKSPALKVLVSHQGKRWIKNIQ